MLFHLGGYLDTALIFGWDVLKRVAKDSPEVVSVIHETKAIREEYKKSAIAEDYLGRITPDNLAAFRET